TDRRAWRRALADAAIGHSVAPIGDTRDLRRGEARIRSRPPAEPRREGAVTGAAAPRRHQIRPRASAATAGRRPRPRARRARTRVCFVPTLTLKRELLIRALPRPSRDSARPSVVFRARSPAGALARREH